MNDATTAAECHPAIAQLLSATINSCCCDHMLLIYGVLCVPAAMTDRRRRSALLQLAQQLSRNYLSLWHTHWHRPCTAA